MEGLIDGWTDRVKEGDVSRLSLTIVDKTLPRYYLCPLSQLVDRCPISIKAVFRKDNPLSTSAVIL